MYGEKLVMRRKVSLEIARAALTIQDEVENLGFSPAPFMFLQHINIGFPLLSEHSRLELPERTTRPRNENARLGLDDCCRFTKPVPGCEEQVYYHALQPAADGSVTVRLVNPHFDGRTFSMSMRYPLAHYPNLVEWKMMRAGNYVVGIEPGNCDVEGRLHERQKGSLVYLQPGEVSRHDLEISFALN
jgi:hypothetical protein